MMRGKVVGCAEQPEAHLCPVGYLSRLMRLLASEHPTVWKIEA